MRKRLVILLLIAAQASFAQTAPPISHKSPAAQTAQNKQEIAGYTVILKPAIRNTFLFSIYNKEKLLHTQMRHPVTQMAVGFTDRNAAFKAAASAIAAYRQTGTFPQAMLAKEATRLQLP